MIVNIPKIRGYLLAISTNFSRLSTDQSEKQEADLALPNLTDRMMALSRSCPKNLGRARLIVPRIITVSEQYTEQYRYMDDYLTN